MTVMPALIERLNEKNCIDTRWISSATGKSVKRVHEDVCRIFRMVENFDHEKDSRGYVKNAWLPLGEALYLMSSYSGPRADTARAFIIEAIDFYLVEAPRLRAENENLRAQIAVLNTQRMKSHPLRKGQLPLPIVQASMFGDAPVVHYVMMAIEGAPPEALDKGRLRHLQRQMEGIAKQVNALQRRLDGEITQ